MWRRQAELVGERLVVERLCDGCEIGYLCGESELTVYCLESVLRVY
ncbi:MAG: hypothetical protein NTY09_01420 [bacterium]|nr:hypothetical protein [bacterium]